MNAIHRPPTIWVSTPSGRKVAHRVTSGSVVVGRDPDVGLVLPFEQVSRRHAELFWDGDRLWVRDLDSRNGTRVNGTPVADWVDLEPGDVVGCAGVEFVVQNEHDGTPVRDVPEPAPESLTRVPVFVSHSSQDKAAAREISRFLGGRGWQVWIDEAGIAGGKQWHGELIRALESAWAVLLLISHPSMRSRWVIREVQAADRLGLQVIPVVVDDAPYPDELRMILSGVQRLELTEHTDASRRRQQLARLDDALITAAQARRRTPPGRVLIAVGSFVRIIGLVGVILGFALFAYLGYSEVNDPSPGSGIPRPFIGWGVFAVFLVVAAVGEAVRRAGLRKGI